MFGNMDWPNLEILFIRKIYFKKYFLGYNWLNCERISLLFKNNNKNGHNN